MSLVTEVVFKKIESLNDGSWKLIFETGEMGGAELGKLGDMKNKYLKMYITEDGVISDDHIEAINKTEISSPKLKQKSASVRMRSMLYRLHIEDTEGMDDFNKYYEVKMNEIISDLSAKL